MTPVTINIADPGTVTDVNLRIRANHTFVGDLQITLTAPDGTTSVLVMDANGGNGDNLGTGPNDCSGTKTVFDDEAGTSIGAGAAPFAGSFIPLNALSAIDGQAVTGTWTLNINDTAALDGGTLGCVDLEIARLVPIIGETCGFDVTVNDTEPPVATCPADINVALPPNQTTLPVNFLATSSDNCPGEILACVPPSGSAFGAGTTVVNCSATDVANNTSLCSFDVAVQAQSVVDVPTLSWTGLAGLVALLAVAALVALRRGS
jgi:subtilisin-like proprotein convertase family protein